MVTASGTPNRRQAPTENVYGAILDTLANHQPKTLAQIEQAVAPKKLNFGHVMEAVIVLTGAAQMVAVQDEAATLKAKPQTQRLNAHVMDKARGSIDISQDSLPGFTSR